MIEDAWLRCEREYFAKVCGVDIPKKQIDKMLEEYNRFLQKALIGDSPHVAEDLRLTILKSREPNVREQES